MVSHGMALRIVLGTLQGMSMEKLNDTHHADNTAVSLVEYENGSFRVVFRDDNSHLLEKGLSTFARQTWWKDKYMAEKGVWYGDMDEEARAELEGLGVSVPEGGHIISVRYEDSVIGGVQMLPEGLIGWYFLCPEWRGRRFGLPPLGQAVRYYREQGLDSVRVDCADEKLRPFFLDYDLEEMEKRYRAALNEISRPS